MLSECERYFLTVEVLFVRSHRKWSQICHTQTEQRFRLQLEARAIDRVEQQGQYAAPLLMPTAVR